MPGYRHHALPRLHVAMDGGLGPSFSTSTELTFGDCRMKFLVHSPYVPRKPLCLSGHGLGQTSEGQNGGWTLVPALKSLSRRD
jgi:hypothetical protein